ncbi:MAG: clostripain [Clostridia bacterium]|nr:clostripain [Clostridia bacterium]
MKRLFMVLLAALLMATLISPGAAADAPDHVTVMVYCDASDLESDDGSATADINEMLYANVGSNVSVIICAGGTKKWRNSVISADTNQYYSVERGQLVFLRDAGKKDMTDAATLREFIGFCAENYPAERNILIMWDHGGGSLYGFGCDERFDPDHMMPLDELGDALDEAGVYFDIIGFDACLMATAETAVSVAASADYLIASEETEPGTGWYYTDWLSRLSADPGIDSETLGRIVIDDFFRTALEVDPTDILTLSMLDLDRFQDSTLPRLWAFSGDASSLIDDGSFAVVSHARSGARSYGANDYDQVDLADFASHVGTDSAAALIEAISDAVVYNRATHNMKGSSGLAIYFPCDWLYELDDMLETYGGLEWDESYLSLIGSFASMQAAGRQAASAPQDGFSRFLSIVNQMTGYDAFSWYNAAYAGGQSGYISSNHLNGDELKIFLKNDDYYALSLSDEEWDLIVDAQLQVYVDDGEGYVELGSDDIYQIDDDGDLIVEFDYTWVALDGVTVVYYAEDYVEDGDYFCYSGYVPAELNGEDVELVLNWDSEHDGGFVRGARYPSEGGAAARGLVALKDGDVIQPWCDYYTYDGKYDGEYYFGDPITVRGDISVTYDDIGDSDTAICYMLTDIYGNAYWTEMVYYE